MSQQIKGVKRRQRAKMPRTGIKVVRRVDRGQQILDNPTGYFQDAKVRARQQVDRDLKRLA